MSAKPTFFSFRDRKYLIRFTIAFVGGFLAVLLFHQVMLAVLYWVKFATQPAYSLEPTKPLGVPKVLSAAFWGGVWGIIFALTPINKLRDKQYWLGGVLFGAICPTLVSWLLVMPLKGLPVGGGWKFPGMVTGLLVNGAWGLGTILLIRLLSRRH